MNGFALEILKKNKERMSCLALVDKNGSRRITWESLTDKICRVAAYARKNGIHGIVPVYMEKGMESAATLLGLNLAGVGVAPLSITTPMTRCENIAAQTNNRIWTIEDFNAACLCAPAYELCSEGNEAVPAYVVFTSGSTGVPKGVMIKNEGVMAGIHRSAGPDFFDLNTADRVMEYTSASFIVHVSELLAPLYAGATVYTAPEEYRGDMHMLSDFINRCGITCFFMSPQFYRNFKGAPSVKCVVIGGDRISNIGPKGHRLVSVYGMSETAGFAFHYDIKEPLKVTPIGLPSDALHACVLDEEGKEADEGELCMSGKIAYAYLGMEELSGKTFIKNPFSDEKGYDVLLRSGDIVRKMENGEYLFISRRDNMIKINGQRVEPGEIETALMNCPGIDVAAVKGFTDENQRSIICAYYTCNRTVNEKEIRAQLEKKLPGYMVPAVMVRLDKIPLNNNGKIDRKALSAPDFSRYLDDYEAPVGSKETLICEAFEKVLHIEKVGRNDDFFRIGGDSISALGVVSECEKIGISTGDIFAGKTPKSIAALSENICSDVYKNLSANQNKVSLTDSQLGILLECGLDEKSTKYNIPVKISLDVTDGTTAASLKDAVDCVIKNHPALYSRIAQEDGEFFMVRENFPKEGICTLSDVSAENFEKEISAPVAIGKDALCRASVCLSGRKAHVFLNMHHVVSDGSSVAVVARELKEAVSGIIPAPEAIDAFSLYEAESRIKASRAHDEAHTYFENLLGNAEIDSNLVPDNKVREDAEPVGAYETFAVSREKVEKYLANTDITENTFFMGVFGYVLAKMTGQSESLFVAAENGRGNPALEGTVSMLVKTLPVILKIDEEKSARELLSALQTQFFATMRNDSVSFGDLAKEFGIRSDVMFVYQADMLDSVDILPNSEALSNLSLMVFKREDSYAFRIEYRAEIYEKYTIARFSDLYERMVDAFIGGAPLKDAVLIGDGDRAYLDRENAANCHGQEEETILDIFRKTVSSYPEKTAIVSDGRSYTFREVDALSDKIACYLLDNGIGRGKAVSVLIPRCEYMLIASMGVMKAGAAYQPLDPSYPEERLAFMISDAKVSLIIKDRKFSGILKDYSGKVLYTDEIESLECNRLEMPKVSPEDTYILLYTSGTTGTPKGVMLSHGNLSAFAHAHVLSRSLKTDSVVAQYASYGFDAHMIDLYPSVLVGCTVTIIPDEIRLDLAGIKDFCEESGVTHLFMTTQVARQFVLAYPNVKGLELLDTGGEKLVSFNPKNTYKLVNLYGPTEGTVCSTRFEVDRYYDNIPIGRATYNYRVYVADTYGRRVPVGVPGELIQCGPQVGLGYLGRPDLSEKVFIRNPFEAASKNYERCYKTGDIVRFINDGNIEYIGRRDHQVKIRGFRIELGEVEKAILDYEGIKSVAVTVVENESGKSLCAYIVADEKIDVADLGHFIAASHPSYMVPAVTMQIDNIPLNANGKVDKRKLPRPELHVEDAKKPENELQQQIFDCVAEAIGTDEFGTDTDIFMAGLSSIGSIRLCTLLSEKFDIPVKIRDLKRCQTVLGLEKFISGTVAVAEKENAPDAQGQTAKVVYGPSYPITKTMEGIFIECLQRPGSTVYNIPYLLKLGDGIDEDKLKCAVAAAVEAHSCMKTEIFTDSDGNICQHMRLDDTFQPSDIKVLELNSDAEINDSLVRSFELTDSRLFEISLIHADSRYLLVNIHHIISDGTSMMIFINDIERAYAGESLQPEKYSSFDIAREEKESRTREELKTEKNYYESILEGVDKDFLPAPDRPEDAPLSKGTVSMEQTEADCKAIRDFCQKQKISQNAYFVSVFGTVLARYAGTDYSVFNTVYNGRNDSRTGSTVAMLVKTLPVVCHVDKDSVGELLHEISAQLMDSMANDLYSYAEISMDFDIKNDVMFIFQGDSFVKDSFCGEKAEEITLGLTEAKAAMALQVLIKNGRLCYDLEYDPKKFTEQMATAIVQAFDKAASSFMKEGDLSHISLLSAAAETDMEKYNDTAMEYDKSETIVDLFEKNAKLYPDSLCVEYHDKKFTYGEIDELTAKLAYFLMNEGIGRGDVVAILINRDENMVIGAHGTIRAGVAYLGLDPTYPPERLEFMVKDSGARYLIADRSLIHVMREYSCKVIYTDEITTLPLPAKGEYDKLAYSSEHRATPEDNALIVYSSGTTGLPKGSILRHRNIVCFYHNYATDYDIGHHSHLATYASFGFDGGAMDVFSSPMAGAALYIVPDEIRLDLSKLEQFYIKNEITNGFMTTQVGCMFISATKCRTLKYFLVGGEKLIPVAGPDWVIFTNGYGPSETMCYVNKYAVKNAGSLQPIGKVSRNTKEYIIDKFGNRLPYGACGELCIAGGQVGRGYLNRPEKTAEVFVRNPFCNDPDYPIMYRTGDVVRMLPDGNYDFVGRRDGQVKIRGFRIELGEIEQQIRRFPGVTNAVVKAWDNPSGGKFLAAYVVMNETMDTEAIRSFILSEKPDYMVPTVMMQLDNIPLTSNGKVDSRKLPKPELGALKKGAEPANETEEKLCAIFGEVVGVGKVYADDDFFKIGGSSISAIQVVVKCEQAGYPVVYKNLFANPTPQRLAEFIAGGQVKHISANDTDKGSDFDYSALDYNVMKNLPTIRNDGVGDVLLTGATGYLGSHIFRELIESTSGKVICLARSKDGMPSDIRLEAMMTYYFEDWFRDEMKDRTVVIDGELEDEDIKEKLGDVHFDTIINCAANVKHFAVENQLLSSNFSGVEHLIELAEAKGAKLIQISTISVCGESVNGSVPADRVFRECDLNIGQSLENQYVYTKFLSEQAVIDAVSKKRIRGKVIRLGNLMARMDDSQFQVNAGQNGMLRMYLGFAKLGCFPVNMLDAELEFSPIDMVARAVVLLSGTPDEFTVFHARNCNSIHYGYLLQAIIDAGYPIDIVEDEVFEERLQKALQNRGDVTELGGLLAYRSSVKSTMTGVTVKSEDDASGEMVEERTPVSSSTAFTTKALYRLGFAWPLISTDYLKKMVDMLVEFDFFER